MQEHLVKINAVNKSYGHAKTPILSNLNLKVKKGEFLALMGPSGSGKTTLLNLVAGLDRPDSGQILIENRDISELKQSQLTAWRGQHVGIVFQFYHLLDILNARQNVELPLLLTRLSRAQRRYRADLALDMVGLADRADYKPKALSGGQQQRVAIARAIVCDPSLLVCDEPTGDLDRASADDILAILSMLSRDQNKTIVMVTHDPKAARCAGRVVTMDKGELVSL